MIPWLENFKIIDNYSSNCNISVLYNTPEDKRYLLNKIIQLDSDKDKKIFYHLCFNIKDQCSHQDQNFVNIVGEEKVSIFLRKYNKIYKKHKENNVKTIVIIENLPILEELNLLSILKENIRTAGFSSAFIYFKNLNRKDIGDQKIREFKSIYHNFDRFILPLDEKLYKNCPLIKDQILNNFTIDPAIEKVDPQYKRYAYGEFNIASRGVKLFYNIKEINKQNFIKNL